MGKRGRAVEGMVKSMSDEATDADATSANPVFDEASQTVIDRHLHAIMSELEAIGVRPLGIVAGVLHDGETSVNWCVADREGAPVEHERVAREIAADVGASMRP